ncbi:alpha/beta hydrolase [Chloroflexota bacterium]
MSSRTEATIHTSDVLEVVSKNTGDKYQVSISLPPSYDHKPAISFPVVYVMDGSLFFEIVSGTARMMQLGGLIPEVVIVSVGYPLESFYGADYLQFFSRRAKDLTSAIDEKYEKFVRSVIKTEDIVIETGGAEPFRKFVTDELSTLIEGRYRVLPDDKTLLGDSTGGHFALYTLLCEPRAFQRYIVGSPALGTGERALFKKESEYAKNHKDLPARLFLGIGDQEEHSRFSPSGYLGTIVSVSDFYRFAAILEDRSYEGLKLTKRVFSGFDHTDVIGPIVAAGLRSVFDKP